MIMISEFLFFNIEYSIFIQSFDVSSFHHGHMICTYSTQYGLIYYLEA